jgi:hypothetical protein
MLLEWASFHRDEIRADWEKARDGVTLAPIEPLE